MNSRAEWLSMAIEPFDNILTDWEAGFMQNVRDRLERGGDISDAQLNKLEQIKEKYT